MTSSNLILTISLLALTLTLIPFSTSQTPAATQPPCNGISLTYSHTKTTPIPPDLTLTDPSSQPYRFDSILTILNNGLEDLKSWIVFVGFQHKEYLVSAENAVLTDGTTLPADVANGTSFSGFPTADLKTAIETAGDLTQM